MTNPTKSIWKGAVAGLAGGLAGAAAKAYMERLYASRMPAVPSPHAKLEQAGTVLANHFVSDYAPTPVPWVFCGLAGAAYGTAVEREPSAAAWQGTAFGLAMGRVDRAAAQPDADPGSPAATQARISSRVTHAVFGFVTEMVRRGVRRGLR